MGRPIHFVLAFPLEPRGPRFELTEVVAPPFRNDDWFLKLSTEFRWFIVSKDLERFVELVSFDWSLCRQAPVLTCPPNHSAVATSSPDLPLGLV
ncbi:hypothetical protein GE061_003262 [Apolygus lucorum]|uniref:Uncharacterized protein n=1 Tax=Apolygus lucorum TaxID=248454 RepID=A0A8S9X1J6_APOLU|nr:hypothetical protein GE061_003262 [Apolygus lucorum]